MEPLDFATTSNNALLRRLLEEGSLSFFLTQDNFFSFNDNFANIDLDDLTPARRKTVEFSIILFFIRRNYRINEDIDDSENIVFTITLQS
ncbi:MAG: hypothetical protein FDX30_09060 [Chlorobium sp.]|nr:MAG: hypothetical protein FDX30_09060 [Chlorobium sp.]